MILITTKRIINTYFCAFQTNLVFIKLKNKNIVIFLLFFLKCISSLSLMMKFCSLIKIFIFAFVIKSFFMCKFFSVIIIKYWIENFFLNRSNVLIKMIEYDKCKLNCELSFLNLNFFSNCFSIRAMFDELFTNINNQILKIQSLNIFILNQIFVIFCVNDRPEKK